MFAAFEKCSRQTFAPDGKCLRPLKNGAKAKEEKIRNQIERRQLNNLKFQRSEN
jgi:hypothetical protein